VRIETEKTVSAALLKRLASELGFGRKMVFRNREVIDYSFLNRLYAEIPEPSLKYESEKGSVPEWSGENPFRAILKKDRCLYHPYHSFDPVVNMLREAAEDPKVLAVKMVLYRVGRNSPVIRALKRAAENGKQVSVLLELYARFDEQNNMENAKILEEAGAHVIYGVMGLKTHAKTMLIIRRGPGGIRRYAHLATGNYNIKTAGFYSDFGMMTAREDIAEDVSHLFNVITGYSRPLRWRKLGVAPINLREKILELIENEIKKSRKEMPGSIFAKMNSLLDPAIIEALYEASRKSVKVNLVVRGICALRPGIPGVSGNISVKSIVGKYLEHARIFRFGNGGAPLYFFSSADWMPRNLDKRIEILVPAEDDEAKSLIDKIIALNAADNTNSWMLNPDGSYKKIKPESGDDAVDIFRELYKLL
jgi:polyphosphate kinase